MSTNPSERWSVFVWFANDWQLHHTYPSKLAAGNAANALAKAGKLAFTAVAAE